MRLRLISIAATIVVAAIGLASPYKPTPEELRKNYEAANTLQQRFTGRTSMLNIAVVWSPNSEWLAYTKERRSENFYIRVESKTGRKQDALDPGKVAAALSKVTNKEVNSSSMRLRLTGISDDGSTVEFIFENEPFAWNGKTEELKRLPQSQGGGPGSRQTPKPATQIRGGRVEIKTDKDENWRPLGQATNITRIYRSPDNSHLIGMRLIEGDRRNVYLLKSSVRDTTRATLEERLYDQPGDKLDTYEVFLYDLKTETEKKIAIDPILGGGQPWSGAPGVQWWGGMAVFTYPIRGYQQHKVIGIELGNGNVRTLVDETSKTFIDQSKTQLRLFGDGKRFIWQSERSGWSHLYLGDQSKSALTPITKGTFIVRSLQHVDESKGVVSFTANGFGPTDKFDPYHIHYLRANLDGSGLVDLTPEDAYHQASFSPNRQYFVNTASRVDMLPIHELRDGLTGKVIARLESGEVDPSVALKTERFIAKGRDGKTDIWGVVIRPTHWDPNKKYPVVENIYAGPHDSFVPKQYRTMHNMHRLAELGFIVVQIDGMGTNNRGKEFHDVAWKNIKDAGFPDRIAWMKALAAKDPSVDINRVGIYGTSAGGQNSAGALLFHGDFYDVAVSSCGCHDNRIDKQWWNEQWMGYPVGPHYDEQSNITHAKNLRGKLMLFVGEQDRNVPPESTIRFADALIKAGKDFDLLVLPGADHTDGGPYGERRRRDYFVRWLLGVEPPDWNSGD